MIIEAIVIAITAVIKVLASPFNLILPDTPETLRSAADYYFNIVFDNLDFLNFFVNVGTLKAVAIIAIAIWTLDNAYSFLIWIIHKLPIGVN